MTVYYTLINKKVENQNSILGDMLTKYFVSKPTKLWNEYLL